MTIPPPSPGSDEPWTCPRCAAAWEMRRLGRRWFVPYGENHAVEGCERCNWRDCVRPEIASSSRVDNGLDRGLPGAMTLENFVPATEKERSARRAAEKVAARWAEGVARSLWLWAPLMEPPVKRTFGERELYVSGCGCGKTHLAVALAKAAADMGRRIKIITENDLLDAIRASYQDGATRSESEILREVGQPWLLVLDDVGTANVKSADWYKSILYGIVDTRYKDQRPIVLTTNLGPADLAERLGPRTMSRLSEMGVGVHLDGPDRRLMK